MANPFDDILPSQKQANPFDDIIPTTMAQPAPAMTVQPQPVAMKPVANPFDDILPAATSPMLSIGRQALAPLQNLTNLSVGVTKQLPQALPAAMQSIPGALPLPQNVQPALMGVQDMSKDIALEPSRLPKGVAGGVGGMVEGAGGTMRWLGAENLGKSVADYGREMQEYYAVKDPKFIDQVASGLGSMTTFLIPGLGISRVATALKFAPIISEYFGVTASSLMEAGTEAGSTYENALKQGKTPEEASKAADAVFFGNMPLLLATNRFGGLFEEGGGSLAKVLKSGLMEGSQESGQQVMGNVAAERPIGEGVAESAAIGAILGSGAKTVLSGIHAIDAKKGKAPVSPSANVPAPSLPLTPTPTDVPVKSPKIQQFEKMAGDNTGIPANPFDDIIKTAPVAEAPKPMVFETTDGKRITIEDVKPVEQPKATTDTGGLYAPPKVRESSARPSVAGQTPTETPSQPQELSMPAETAKKEPWEMTRAELIQHQINRNRKKIQEALQKESELMGMAPKPQGNLTRKGDLNYKKSKEFSDKHGREITLWAEKAKNLEKINADFNTPEGMALVKNYHKEAISKALASGKPVPPEVLSDYPELQKQEPVKPFGTPEIVSNLRKTIVEPEEKLFQRKKGMLQQMPFKSQERKVTDEPKFRGEKKKYIALFDMAWGKDGAWFSRKVKELTDEQAAPLLEKGRIREYEPKRFVNVTNADGKTQELAWGDYLKRNNRIKKGEDPKFRSEVYREQLKSQGINITSSEMEALYKENERLFGDRDLRIVDRVLTKEGNDALGQYYRGMIDISTGKANKLDTFYHEAYHKMKDMFATEEEKDAIHKDLMQRGKDEEWEAEAFIAYAKNRQGVLGRLRAIFDAILERIKLAFGKGSVTNKLMADLVAGRAKVQKAAPRWVQEPAVARDITKMEAFKKWFGNSKVVDEKGMPLVVYHGTTESFSAFDKSLSGKMTGATSASKGMFFTDDPRTAWSYATYAAENAPVDSVLKQADMAEKKAQRSGKQSDWDAYNRLVEKSEKLDEEIRNDNARGQNTIPVYLAIKNPKVIDAHGERFVDISRELNRDIDNAKRMGKDGVIIKNLDDSATFADSPSTHYVVFEPTQIKSAFGNIGTFDPTNPDIRYREEKKEPTKKSLLEVARSLKKQAWDDYRIAKEEEDRFFDDIGVVNVRYFAGKEEWKTVHPDIKRKINKHNSVFNDLDEAAESMGMTDDELLQILNKMKPLKKPSSRIADYIDEAKEQVERGRAEGAFKTRSEILNDIYNERTKKKLTQDEMRDITIDLFGKTGYVGASTQELEVLLETLKKIPLQEYTGEQKVKANKLKFYIADLAKDLKLTRDELADIKIDVTGKPTTLRMTIEEMEATRNALVALKEHKVEVKRPTRDDAYYTPAKQSRKLPSSLEWLLDKAANRLKDLSAWEGQSAGLTTLAPTRAAEKMDGKQFGIMQQQLQAVKDADKLRLAELKRQIEWLNGIERDIKATGKAKEFIFDVIDGKITTDNEKVMAIQQKVRNWYEALLTRINQARQKIGKEPVKRRTDYITHLNELSLINEIVAAFHLKNISSLVDIPTSMLSISEYTKPNSPYFKFAKQRLGEMSDRDPMRAMQAYIEPALNSIYLSKPIHDFRDILEYEILEPSDYEGGDPDRKKLFNERYPHAHTYWTHYLNRLSGKRDVADRHAPVVAEVVGVTNMLFSAGSIGGNLSTVIIQPSSFALSYTELGKYAITGQLLAMSSERWDFAQRNSRILMGRQYEPPQKGSRIFGHGKVGRAVQRINEVSSIPVSFVDRVMATGAWLGAYEKAKREMKLNEEDAYRYADNITEKTQASASLVDRPPINNGKIKTALGQFQTFVYNQYSYLKQDIVKKFGSPEAIPQGFDEIGLGGVKDEDGAGYKRFIRFAIAVVLLNALYKALGLRRPFGEDKKSDGWMSALLSTVSSLIPFISTIRYGGSPVIQLARSVADIWSNDTRQKQEGWNDLKTVAMRLIPTGGQISKTWNSINAMSNDGEVRSKSGKTVNFRFDTDNPVNVVKALAFGPYWTKEGQAFLDKMNGAKEESSTVRFAPRKFGKVKFAPRKFGQVKFAPRKFGNRRFE